MNLTVVYSTRLNPHCRSLRGPWGPLPAFSDETLNPLVVGNHRCGVLVQGSPARLSRLSESDMLSKSMVVADTSVWSHIITLQVSDTLTLLPSPGVP